MSTVQIKIAGIDETDKVVFERSSFESAVNGTVGTARIMVRDLDRTYSVVPGSILELIIDGDPIWTGFVMIVRRGYVFPALNVDDFGLARFFEIEGSDLNILFQKRFAYTKADPTIVFGQKYPPATPDTTAIADLVADYLDLSGDGLDTSTHVENVGDINVDQEARAWLAGDTWAEAMTSIASLPGAVYFLAPTYDLIYTDVNTENAPYGLSDQPGVGEVGYREMVLTKDGTQLANDVLAWGMGLGSSEPVFTRLIDTSSVNTHNLWQAGVVKPGIYKQATIERVADSIVYGSPSNKRGSKDDRTNVRLVTYQPGFLPAQKVAFESNVFGFSDVIPIRFMKITFDSPQNPRYEITLSHAIDAPWGFFDPFFLDLPGFNLPELPGLPVIDYTTCVPVTRYYPFISDTITATGKRWLGGGGESGSAGVSFSSTSNIPLFRVGNYYDNITGHAWQTSANAITCPAGTGHVGVEMEISSEDWVVGTNPLGQASEYTFEVIRCNWGSGDLTSAAFDDIYNGLGTAELVTTITVPNIYGAAGSPGFPPPNRQTISFDFDLFPGQTKAQFYFRPVLFPGPSMLVFDALTATNRVTFYGSGLLPAGGTVVGLIDDFDRPVSGSWGFPTRGAPAWDTTTQTADAGCTAHLLVDGQGKSTMNLVGATGSHSTMNVVELDLSELNPDEFALSIDLSALALQGQVLGSETSVALSIQLAHIAGGSASVDASFTLSSFSASANTASVLLTDDLGFPSDSYSSGAIGGRTSFVGTLTIDRSATRGTTIITAPGIADQTLNIGPATSAGPMKLLVSHTALLNRSLGSAQPDVGNIAYIDNILVPGTRCAPVPLGFPRIEIVQRLDSTHYRTQYAFTPGSTMVWRNGILQRRGTDYTEEPPNILIFDDPVADTEVITIVYYPTT